MSDLQPIRLSAALLLAVLGLGAYGATWAEELSDPTRPPSPAELAAWRGHAPTGASSEFRLESILIGAGRRVAIINGRRLTEGETIDAATVVRIRPSRVELELDGRTLQLNVRTWSPDPMESR